MNHAKACGHKVPFSVLPLVRLLEGDVVLVVCLEEPAVELQMNVREDFIITEKVPTRAFFWLKAPTSAFTFKTL